MARNQVQLQEGYRLMRFLDDYSTEEKCTGALFRWRWPNGFVCPRRDHTGYLRLRSRALYQCRGCLDEVSLTAGTVPGRTKLPLRTWFRAMYQLTQTKNVISSLELSRQLGVSYNSAWSVKHKLMQVMKERDDTRPLGGWVQLDDAYLGGERRGGKRGRRAPDKTPFVAAVQVNLEDRPARMRLIRVGAIRSEEIAGWAKWHLEPGTLVLSDALGCFSAVQHAGCFRQPIMTEGGPESTQHPALSRVNTILGNIKRSLHGIYHHVSSKHLARYLAEFSYWFNRRFLLPEMFPRLAYVALRAPPMPYRVLKLAENNA